MWKPAWNILYLLGKSPWDTGITPPELEELIRGGQIPPGRALDIGCGTGTNAIYLARSGFQTAGVDIASLAIIQAKYKARRAGVPVKFYVGDVLKMGMRGKPAISVPIDFALDIGCLHSLAATQLQSYVAMLQRVCI
jgi:ubiquinone/menaquinone biosynthesis C-methylase UbiE